MFSKIQSFTCGGFQLPSEAWDAYRKIIVPSGYSLTKANRPRIRPLLLIAQPKICRQPGRMVYVSHVPCTVRHHRLSFPQNVSLSLSIFHIL